MVIEIIEAAAHFEQEDAQRVCAHEVEVRPVPMFVPLLAKFPEEEPFQVESQNSVLCKVDASLLLVLHSLPRRTDVAIDVQDRREFAHEFLRLVKDRDRLKAGYDFVAQLAQAVSLTRFDHPEVFELGRGVDPFFRPAVIDDILQQVPAQALGFFGPLLGVRGCGRRSDAVQDIGLYLEQGRARREYLFTQDCAQVIGIALAISRARDE